MNLALRFSLVTCAVIVTTAPVRADLIFLNDGYVLQGSVRRETRAEFDPVGRDVMLIPKGFFTIDDGPRRVYFAPSQVRIIEPLPSPGEDRLLSHGGRLIVNPRVLPPHLGVVEEGKWNLKKWERDYYFRSPDSPRVALIQGLATLSPYYARVDAVTKYKWSAAYLTREWDPDLVLELLKNSPHLQDQPADKTLETVARRFRICDFLAQAGWYDHAQRELDRLLKDFPDQKDRVVVAQTRLDRACTKEAWEQIKHWYQAGRLVAVRRRIANFPLQQASDRIRADLAELKAKLAASAELLADTSQALHDTLKEMPNAAESRLLADAAQVILAELHEATTPRLDAFLGQYREAQRQKAQGKKPSLGPEQLLSLAVTGWLLGSPSAEARPEAALSLWKTRDMILQYLNETNASERRRRVEKYLAEISPKVDFDEIAQMIAHLPPAEPAKDTGPEAVEREVGSSRRPTSYLVKLPPEYTHNRAYPLLIVLHDGEETPADMLARFEYHAAEHGYILAAPAWRHPQSNQYHYTQREHETVLNAIRDLKRRYQIDSDRVFLTGLGEGGKMAFDFGLAHPDLFAGVLPMAAGPDYYAKRCWRNANILPFYVVNGTRGADSQKLLRETFENWVMRSYPALWVEYKGRGTEFFSAELPMMFDWMRHQKRAFPLRQLGTDGNGSPFGNEFCTLRGEENRFYWLEPTHVSPRNVVYPDRWLPQTSPAMLTARVEPVANEITIKCQGIVALTVWIGRNSAGQYLVDLDKPVNIRVGLRGMFNNKVTPSLAVLLEDLYRRGDRQHLVAAKVELNLR